MWLFDARSDFADFLSRLETVVSENRDNTSDLLI